MAPLWHRSRSRSTWSGCQRFAGAAPGAAVETIRGRVEANRAPFDARCAPGAVERGRGAALPVAAAAGGTWLTPGSPAPGAAVAWRRTGRRSMMVGSGNAY